MAAAADDLAPTLEILERLIGFDTTSRNSNLQLIEWVEAFLAARGIGATRVSNADGTKANLYAVIGPAVEGGVVLSGHTDVVPVDDQPWTSNPWGLTERGTKFYGRGVADMKTFSALALAHVDAMLAASLRRPIILALSYDEEVGCLGAPSMIAELREGAAPPPSAVIVGEPTDMKVVSGHKGVRGMIVEVTGREAHSSQTDQGVSAVMEALKLMNLVVEMGRQARASPDADPLFSPPGASMTIGRVHGGTAMNILARRCEFVWDLRWPPEADPDLYEGRFREAAAQLDAEIKRRAPEGGVRVTRRSNNPPLKPDLASEAEALARALTGDNETRVAAYAAEAGLFQRAGMAAVLCGPGSILQAHQPDEWIERDQIAQGARFMRGLIARLSA
ncbi:MAG TPA: acetylornithine deacetylase [Caulobacterales bacterium]|nr:acetylornithine deacetylase [Caulobacterales bacterium]